AAAPSTPLPAAPAAWPLLPVRRPTPGFPCLEILFDPCVLCSPRLDFPALNPNFERSDCFTAEQVGKSKAFSGLLQDSPRRRLAGQMPRIAVSGNFPLAMHGEM